MKAILDGTLPGVIRAKGHFWLATRPERVAEFSLAGALSSTGPIGKRWATMPPSSWPDDDGVRAYLEERWEKPFGDRRQEIVFIGSDIDWPALKARLDAVLVPAMPATSLDSLPPFEDPFAPWQEGTA